MWVSNGQHPTGNRYLNEWMYDWTVDTAFITGWQLSTTEALDFVHTLSFWWIGNILLWLYCKRNTRRVRLRKSFQLFTNKVLRKVKIRRGQAGLIEFTQEFKMNCVVAPSRTLVTWAGLPLLFRLIHRQNCTTSRHAPIVLFPILELTFLEIGTQYVLLVCLCIAAGRSFSWIPEEEGMLMMRDERRNKERQGYSVLSQWMDIGRLRFAIWPPVGTTALTARSVTNWRHLHCHITFSFVSRWY